MRKSYKQRTGKRGRRKIASNTPYQMYCRYQRGEMTYREYEIMRGWRIEE